MSGGTFRRIGALVLRHWYLISRSPPRLLDLCYWPILQMMLWGFIQRYLTTQSEFFAQAAGLLIAWREHRLFRPTERDMARAEGT